MLKTRKPLILALTSFIILLLVSVYIVFQAYEANITTKEKLADSKLHAVGQLITNKLDAKKQLADVLAGFVSYKGYITQSEFQNFAKYIVEEKNTKIISLQWAPAGKIKYIYPVRNNEKAFGLDLFTYPTTREPALASLKSRKPHINGPIPLIQGGVGIVYRVPVFKINYLAASGDDTTKQKAESDFLGYTAVVIDWKSFIQECGIEKYNPASIALKFTDNVEAKKFHKNGVFLGNASFFKENVYSDTLDVSDEKWILGTKTSNEQKDYYSLVLYLILSFIFSFIIACFIFINSKKNTLIKAQNVLLKENNQKIEHQVSEKVVLINEIHHRVKNNFQLVSSLARLQSYELNDPKSIEVLQEFSNRVSSLALTHDQLLQNENDSNDTSIKNYIQSLSENLLHSNTHGHVTIKADIVEMDFPIKYLVHIGIILNELITNSLKYAFEGRQSGEISISLQEKNSTFELNYTDNGIGTEKQMLENTQNSFGIDLIKTICEQIDASIEQINRKGEFGFQISFRI